MNTIKFGEEMADAQHQPRSDNDKPTGLEFKQVHETVQSIRKRNKENKKGIVSKLRKRIR
jgi:hypothetical protein